MEFPRLSCNGSRPDLATISDSYFNMFVLGALSSREFNLLPDEHDLSYVNVADREKSQKILTATRREGELALDVMLNKRNYQLPEEIIWPVMIMKLNQTYTIIDRLDNIGADIASLKSSQESSLQEQYLEVKKKLKLVLNKKADLERCYLRCIEEFLNTLKSTGGNNVGFTPRERLRTIIEILKDYPTYVLDLKNIELGLIGNYLKEFDLSGVNILLTLKQQDEYLTASQRLQFGPGKLFKAAESGDVKEIERLVRAERVNVNSTNSLGRTPLMVAAFAAQIKTGQVAAVRKLIELGADVNRKTSREDFQGTAIGYNLLDGLSRDKANDEVLEIIKLLLENGIEISVHTAASLDLPYSMGQFKIVWSRQQINSLHDGLSPLHLAVTRGHIHNVVWLVEHGADLNLLSSEGWSALNLACDGKSESIALYLIERGAKLDVLPKAREKFSAMNLAIDSGFTSVAVELKNRGIKINRDLNAESIEAAKAGNVQRYKLFVALGADVNHTDKKGMTALMIAAKNNYQSVVNILQENNAKLAIEDQAGMSALMYSIVAHHTSLASCLIKMGANIHSEDNDGRSCLILATLTGDEELVDLILAEKPDINHRDSNGDSALIHAGRQGYSNIFIKLLDKEADINQKNNRNETALINVSCAGAVDIARILLDQANIDVYVQDNIDGKDALSWASLNKHIRIVELLLERHPDLIYITNSDGNNILHFAAIGGDARVIQLLIDRMERRAIDYINELNFQGKDALIVAIENNREDAVKVLLQNGASTNYVDPCGYSSLMLACSKACTNIANLLLNAGVDVNIKDSKGVTALQIAIERGDEDIVSSIIAKSRSIKTIDNIKTIALNLWKLPNLSDKHERIMNMLGQISKFSISLHAAASFCDLTKIQFYQKERINDIDSGQTMLHVASRRGKLENVKWLIEQGANLHLRCSEGYYEGYGALHLACISGHYDVALYLVDRSASINERDRHKDSNQTAIQLAIKNMHFKLADTLKQRGAILTADDEKSLHLLSLAVLAKEAASQERATPIATTSTRSSAIREAFGREKLEESSSFSSSPALSPPVSQQPSSSSSSAAATNSMTESGVAAVLGIDHNQRQKQTNNTNQQEVSEKSQRVDFDKSSSTKTEAKEVVAERILSLLTKQPPVAENSAQNDGMKDKIKGEMSEALVIIRQESSGFELQKLENTILELYERLAASELQIGKINQELAIDDVARREQEYIRSKPALNDYYKTARMELNQSLIASMAIKSGLVEIAPDSKDKVIKGVSLLGKFVPVFGIVFDILEKGTLLISDISKQRAITHLSNLAHDANQAAKLSELYARKLSLEKFKSVQSDNPESQLNVDEHEITLVNNFKSKWKQANSGQELNVNQLMAFTDTAKAIQAVMSGKLIATDNIQGKVEELVRFVTNLPHIVPGASNNSETVTKATRTSNAIPQMQLGGVRSNHVFNIVSAVEKNNKELGLQVALLSKQLEVLQAERQFIRDFIANQNNQQRPSTSQVSPATLQSEGANQTIATKISGANLQSRSHVANLQEGRSSPAAAQQQVDMLSMTVTALAKAATQPSHNNSYVEAEKERQQQSRNQTR